MSHTYASVAELKAFIKDGGDSSSYGLGTLNDAGMLTVLEDCSRAIDSFCARTNGDHPRSGFGPRVGTNHYDGTHRTGLFLDDDLLTISAVTVAASWGASPATLVDETDFVKEPYDRAPYRKLTLVPGGAQTWAGTRRAVAVAGTWGYASETVTSTATLGEDLDSSETGVDVSAGSAFALGQTLLIDTEQFYVTGISSNTLTTTRAANGTTAAAHTTGAAIAVYRYPRQVVATCLRLAIRRWKARDAGLTGVFGGGAIPVTTQPDPSEISILRGGVQTLRIRRAI